MASIKLKLYGKQPLNSLDGQQCSIAGAMTPGDIVEAVIRERS
jgi:hypothetical protein